MSEDECGVNFPLEIKVEIEDESILPDPTMFLDASMTVLPPDAVLEETLTSFDFEALNQNFLQNPPLRSNGDGTLPVAGKRRRGRPPGSTAKVCAARRKNQFPHRNNSPSYGAPQDNSITPSSTGISELRKPTWRPIAPAPVLNNSAPVPIPRLRRGRGRPRGATAALSSAKRYIGLLYKEIQPNQTSTQDSTTDNQSETKPVERRRGRGRPRRSSSSPAVSSKGSSDSSNDKKIPRTINIRPALPLNTKQNQPTTGSPLFIVGPFTSRPLLMPKQEQFPQTPAAPPAIRPVVNCDLQQLPVLIEPRGILYVAGTLPTAVSRITNGVAQGLTLDGVKTCGTLGAAQFYTGMQ